MSLKLTQWLFVRHPITEKKFMIMRGQYKVKHTEFVQFSFIIQKIVFLQPRMKFRFLFTDNAVNMETIKHEPQTKRQNRNFVNHRGCVLCMSEL